MKISWSTGIIITMIIFFVIIFGTVYISTTVNNDLVTDEYYEKELIFQQHIDKVKRTNEIPEALKITVANGSLSFVFPTMFNNGQIEGEIHLYRPSDETKDYLVNINLDQSNNQLISTDNFTKGLWKVKVNWVVEEVEYYNEKIIMIN